MNGPHFGFTRAHGFAVHARVADHHPEGTAYQKFNKRVALFITANVGTMTAFWAFSLLALLSLPATLVLVGWLPAHWVLPAFMMSLGFIYLIQWIAQSYIQLVLLPALMVGQNLQNAASDARSAKQFEDTETIADRLDTATEGGITDVLNALAALDAKVTRLASGESRKRLRGPAGGGKVLVSEVARLAGVTPVDTATGSIIGYILGYGPLGLVALALAFRFLVPGKAADAAADRARTDLLRENARLVEEKAKAEEQRDEALKLARDQVVPLLTSFVATSGSLIPLLQELVRRKEP